MANAEYRSATHTAQRAQGTKAAVPIALSRSQGAASSAVLLGWGWFGSFFCSKLCREIFVVSNGFHLGLYFANRGCGDRERDWSFQTAL
jgi:hypothetical protein